jgi:hypothetical protein
MLGALRSNRLAIASLTMPVALLGIPLGLPGPANPLPISGVLKSLSVSIIALSFGCHAV